MRLSVPFITPFNVERAFKTTFVKTNFEAEHGSNASDFSTKARSSSKSKAVFLMLAPREELRSSFKSAAGRQCKTGRQMCRKNRSPGDATGRGWPGSGHFQGNFMTISGLWDVSRATFVNSRSETEDSECQEMFSILSSPLAVPGKSGGSQNRLPDPSQKSSDLERVHLHLSSFPMSPKGRTVTLCYLSSHSGSDLASHTAWDIDCSEQAKQTQGNHERIQMRVN